MSHLEFGDHQIYSRSTSTAIMILKRGEPLPTYLTAALLEEGVDVETLESKYGQ